MGEYRVEVRVGHVWVPAHRGALSKEKADQLVKAYATDRPEAHVKLTPVRSKSA